jgi:hypothetical protein
VTEAGALGQALARLELALDRIELAAGDTDARREGLGDARRELMAAWGAFGVTPRKASPSKPIDDEGGPLREPDDVEEHRRP